MYRFRQTLRRLVAITTALVLAGCGGGGGAPAESTPVSDTGTVLIGVTDADGDFVSYSVDVLSLTLTRANGSSVETLPAKTRVDFAQLTEMSDLLAAATLAPGDFVGGTLRLDFSNAEVFVEAGGQIVQATVVGEDGNSLGITELAIRLDSRNHLFVTRGRTAFLSLDFDLAASNEVDVGTAPPTVTARPYIVADVVPSAERELRLRGALVSVDAAAGTYVVDLRPAFLNAGNHGRVTVHTNANTAFEIDGVPASGATGLAALAAQPTGTLTVAFGTLTATSHSFTAAIVNAGTSVSGQSTDAVHGSVVSRKGNELTVRGAFAVRPGHDAHTIRTVVVTVGTNTKIMKTGSLDRSLDAGVISVGQNIVAFGTLSIDAAGSDARLDSTQGRIRLLPTRLFGTVNGADPGQLNLTLRAIDRLGVELFDFSGTGTVVGGDADPSGYEVSTGSLALTDVAAGRPAQVVGFVTPFGQAPPDFEGRTVIDHSALAAVLQIGWGSDGTTAPFSTLSGAGFALDLTNPSVGARHGLFIGRRLVDLFDLPASPTVQPSAARALYGIATRSDVELFTSFEEFTMAVATKLGTGEMAVALTAMGAYDNVSNTLSANRIGIYFSSQ